MSIPDSMAHESVLKETAKPEQWKPRFRISEYRNSENMETVARSF